MRLRSRKLSHHYPSRTNKTKEKKKTNRMVTPKTEPLAYSNELLIYFQVYFLTLLLGRLQNYIGKNKRNGFSDLIKNLFLNNLQEKTNDKNNAKYFIDDKRLSLKNMSKDMKVRSCTGYNGLLILRDLLTQPDIT